MASEPEIRMTKEERVAIAVWSQWELGSPVWGLEAVGLLSAMREDGNPKAVLQHALGDEMPDDTWEEVVNDLQLEGRL